MRRRPTQLPKPGGQAGDEATASASLTHSSRPLPRERQTLRPVRTQPRGGPFREEQTSLGPFPGPPSPIASVQSGHRPSCVPAPLPAPDVHQLLSLPPAPLVLGDSPEVPGPEAQAVTQRHRPPPPGLGQPKLRSYGAAGRNHNPAPADRALEQRPPQSGPLWGVWGHDTTEKLRLRTPRDQTSSQAALSPAVTRSGTWGRPEQHR